MSDLKEVLNGVLGTVLNMPEAEVSSLYDEEGNWKEGSTDALKSKHAERVKLERDKSVKDRNEQYNRGLKEKGVEFEKLLKEAGVEIGDAIGADAVKKLVEHIDGKVAAVAKPSDLDDDKVKNSKLYREMEKKFQTELTTKDNEHRQAWTDRDAKEQRERILSKVKGDAKVILDELKPNLPEDPKKAAKLIGVLMQEFEGLSYEMDGDELLIKDSEGKRLENELGHPIKLNDLVKAKSAEYFDFQASDKKGSLGNPLNGTLNKGTVKLQKPANRDELAKQRHAITTSGLPYADRKAANEQLDELAKDLV
jgi:hypothetical protein